MTSFYDGTDLDGLALHVEAWLHAQAGDNPIVDAVVRDHEHPRRWFVRVKGEEKDVYTIRFELRQRTLHYETYVMPAPEENLAEFYAHLLRRNGSLYGASFCLGEEDAVFLQGQLDNGLVAAGEDDLDRVLGSIWMWVERFFRPALRIGFASRFEG